MGNISLQPEPQSPDASQAQKSREPIRLRGTIPTTAVPAEQWNSYGDSKCGVGSDTPVGQGGTLDMKSLTIQGAPAPVREANPDPTGLSHPAPGAPEPPEYLPEMKDAMIVKHTIQALSPRIVAVRGPTGTGKFTVLPLAITRLTQHAEGLKTRLDHLCTAKTDPSTAIV